jgi:hypothetical protein
MNTQELVESGILRRVGHQLVVTDAKALESMLDELTQRREFADMLKAEEVELKGD